MKLIAGNWKMNKTVKEAMELVRAIHYGLPWPGEVDVVVAPPLTALHSVAEFLKNSYIGVAAQNIHWEGAGAYTGEVSAPFVKEAGADFVIIGHSERRQHFGETDQAVNKKIKAALKIGLTPIFCVGETLNEREAGRVNEVIERQITAGLDGITASEMAGIVIAYEPVWAIGTGKTATPDEANEVHAVIKKLISTRIIYGGSVNAKNAKELLHMPNIDGALVGGASLKAEDFIEIVRCT
jgi:triosephosphate isomerase